MHLLLIHQNFPGQFRDLGPGWLRLGHQITALGSAPPPDAPDRWSGLTYLRYGLEDQDNPSPLQRGKAVAAACQQLLRTGVTPDLVLVHSGWGEAVELRDVFPETPLIVFPELWGHPLALGYGFDRHLDQQTPDPDWFDAQNQLAAQAIHASDVAAVPCNAQAQSFPVELQDRLTVIRDGLELERYGADSAARIELNGHLFCAGQPLVTLVARTLEPLRGLRQALLAWPAIATAVPDAQLLLIGNETQGYGIDEPADHSSHLSTSLAALPHDVDRERIHRLGSLDHASMVSVLQCSACHIALSYPYTLSWSVLEAMACGAPLITNPGSPIASELVEGQSGVFVGFNDVEALAEGAVALLQSPHQRRSLGDRALHTAQERFSIKTTLKAYERLFQQLKPIPC